MKTFVLLCFAFTLALGCTKTGPQGATGRAGPMGPAGSNGTVIYSGIGAPSATLGNVGDFYLDTTNCVLYGPKVASGWGAGVSLQGATGPAGPQGPAGPPGTANVMYTPWVTANSWSLFAGYGGQNIIEENITIQGLTSDIVQTGTVICYGDLEDYVTQIWPTGQVAPLPITLLFKLNGTEITDIWECNYTTGTAQIAVYDSQNEFTAYDFLQSRFRWVIIPGGVSIPASIGYKDMMRYLRVPVADY